MLYTEKEKNEIERVRKVFEKHIQQMTGYDLVWSDKVGYVWLAISIDPIYIDTGNWIESAASLCYECLNDIQKRDNSIRRRLAEAKAQAKTEKPHPKRKEPDRERS